MILLLPKVPSSVFVLLFSGSGLIVGDSAGGRNKRKGCEWEEARCSCDGCGECASGEEGEERCPTGGGGGSEGEGEGEGKEGRYG